MAYTSSSFIILLLSGLLVFAFLPSRAKNPALILMSLAWFSTWNIYLPLVLIPVIVIHHYCALKRKIWPAVAISILVLILLRFEGTSLVVGSSFYLLILLAYTLDVARGKSSSLTVEESLLLGSFFPMMMAGPVVRSETFLSRIKNAKVSWESMVDGALVFSLGFLKVQFLHQTLQDLSYHYARQENFLLICSSTLIATLGVYVSLSGFADMGRGIARAFGIVLEDAFRPVIFAKDPSDFWERWNRTVAGWFRDYLVFPSLLRWGRKVPAQIILFGAFVLLGLWHGFEILWLLFGVFNGLMVVAGSAIRKKWGEHFSGRVLVVFLLMGNGLIHVFDEVFHQGEHHWLEKLQQAERLGNISLLFYVGIILLIVVDWFQEKSGENDFYLKWPVSVKRTIAIVLFLLWVLMVDHRAPPPQDGLPLYFNL
ncbi:MAG: MBOAT family O-acyltransferase [Bdellovibrionota bacterium]